MTGTTEFFVILWALPVTVFIIIPLAMLVGRPLVKLVNRLVNYRHKSRVVHGTQLNTASGHLL